MIAKTFAIQRKDCFGVVYTVDYIISRNLGDANIAAAAHGSDAFATEITQDQMERAIDDIIDAANSETSRKLKRLDTSKSI